LRHLASLLRRLAAALPPATLLLRWLTARLSLAALLRPPAPLLLIAPIMALPAALPLLIAIHCGSSLRDACIDVMHRDRWISLVRDARCFA
jgi:hypothetical protein